MRSLPFGEKMPQMPQERQTSAFRRQSSSVPSVFSWFEFFAFRPNPARLCFRPLFIGVSSMPSRRRRLFPCFGVNRDEVVSNLSRVFLVILIEHSEEIRDDLETI
jgi:hypothetical protein